MNRLRVLFLALCLGCGLCHASVIVQRTGCQISSFPVPPPSLLQNQPSCDIGSAQATTSVAFPAAGLAQEPVVLSMSQSARAGYPGNNQISYADTYMYGSVTVIPPATEALFLEFDATITGSGSTLARWTPDFKVEMTTAGGTSTTTYNPLLGCSPLCGLSSTLLDPGQAVTIAITETLVGPIDASAPPPAFRMAGSETAQVQVGLQFYATYVDFEGGFAHFTRAPLTTMYVDQTPEPGTFMLGLVSLCLLLVERSRRRRS